MRDDPNGGKVGEESVVVRYLQLTIRRFRRVERNAVSMQEWRCLVLVLVLVHIVFTHVEYGAGKTISSPMQPYDKESSTLYWGFIGTPTDDQQGSRRHVRNSERGMSVTCHVYSSFV